MRLFKTKSGQLFDLEMIDHVTDIRGGGYAIRLRGSEEIFAVWDSDDAKRLAKILDEMAGEKPEPVNAAKRDAGKSVGQIQREFDEEQARIRQMKTPLTSMQTQLANHERELGGLNDRVDTLKTHVHALQDTFSYALERIEKTITQHDDNHQYHERTVHALDKRVRVLEAIYLQPVSPGSIQTGEESDEVKELRKDRKRLEWMLTRNFCGISGRIPTGFCLKTREDIDKEIEREGF